MTQGSAQAPDLTPDITPGYPSGGSRIGPAWVDVWVQLREAGAGWTDGTGLATRVAADHQLAPSTVRNLFTSAHRVGLLEARYAKVEVPGRGTRIRTHYRIVKP